MRVRMVRLLMFVEDGGIVQSGVPLSAVPPYYEDPVPGADPLGPWGKGGGD